MKTESQAKSSQLKRNHWFEKLNAEAVLPATLYGGKASQLAELMRLGAQVPPGSLFMRSSSRNSRVSVALGTRWRHCDLSCR